MAASHSQGITARSAPAPAYGWSLLEISALCVILAAPLSWPGFWDLYALVPLGVAAAYVIGGPVAAFLRASADLPPKRRVAVFALVQPVGGCAAAGGLSILVSTAWFRAAYRKEIVDPDGMGLGFPLELATMAPFALGLIIAAGAVFLASVILLRRDGDSAGTCFRRIHTDGITILWPAAAAWVLLGLGLLCLANIAASAVSLPALLQSANPSQTVDIRFVASEFPGFPAAILAAAILLVAFRRLQPAALASLREPRRAAAIGIPAVVTAIGGIGMGYGWYLYMLHIGIIAALGPVTMIVSWGEVSRATNAWIEAQQAAGREPADIAADLRRHGRWTADGKFPGLSGFFPELGGTLEELGLSDRCSVTIDAGVADNSALRNNPWIAGYEAGFRPLPPVGYCLRLACPSPAVWHDRPVVILHSSHPSRNRSWAYNVFIDVFGAGAAPEPGGYCTETGALAAEYQG